MSSIQSLMLDISVQESPCQRLTGTKTRKDHGSWKIILCSSFHTWSPENRAWAIKRPQHVLYLPWCPAEEWAAMGRPPLWLISHHKNIFKAMVQAALLTIKRKDHIIAVINHWLRFIIAIIPSKFIVTAVNDQFIRALTILGNGLSRLMRVTTNFSRIIA